MPIDRGAIDAQLREIGEGERWWEQREFRDLPHILHADERIQGLARGKLLGARRPRLRPAGLWLIVITDQRLIGIKQERFARKQVEIAAGQITRVQQSSNFRAFQVIVHAPPRRYRIRLHKDDAFRFMGALTPLVPNSQPRHVSAEMEPWAWIPGMTAVAALPGVSGILSKATLLSPPDPVPRDRIELLEATVEHLQNDVDRLQQQVAFLEELLQQRADDTFLKHSATDG